MNTEVSNAIGLTHVPINPRNDYRMLCFREVWQKAFNYNTQTPLPSHTPIYIPVNNFRAIAPFNKPAINTNTPDTNVTNKYTKLLSVFAQAITGRNPNGNSGIY